MASPDLIPAIHSTLVSAGVNLIHRAGYPSNQLRKTRHSANEELPEE
jgi:methionine synthase I (cobalamin-dependent)